jgi:DNA-binding transcriptional LysR family regulator
MELELHLLRSLLVVAEEGHVGRAARRLSITQPALSRQIQRLEGRIGAPLFDRGPRGVRLTEAGRVLISDARRLLDESDRAIERARSATRGELGHISIGFLASAADRAMAPVLRALRDRHPGISFSLTERPWRTQLDGLASGADDVAFVREVPAGTPWPTLSLFVDPICLVVRHDHPLAARAEVRAEDLAELHEPFLNAPEWLAGRQARWGFQVQVGEDVASPAAQFALARAGFGNPLMPRSFAELAPPDLRFVPVVGETSLQQLAWTKDVRPAVKSFLDVARGVFAGI